MDGQVDDGGGHVGDDQTQHMIVIDHCFADGYGDNYFDTKGISSYLCRGRFSDSNAFARDQPSG